MRATTGRHYKVNISNFRTENAGDGWSPLQYKNVFQILLDSKSKDKKGAATGGRPYGKAAVSLARICLADFPVARGSAIRA